MASEWAWQGEGLRIFFNLTNSSNILSPVQSDCVQCAKQQKKLNLHFPQLRPLRQLLVAQRETIVAEYQPVQLMHLGQVVHGKVAQLIPHQKQPLQTAKFLEDAVRQLAEIVVADFEAFQVRQPIEAARRHA